MNNYLIYSWVYPLVIIIIFIILIHLYNRRRRNFNSPDVTQQPRIFVMRSAIVTRAQPGSGPRQLPVIHAQEYPHQQYGPPPMYPKQEGSQMPTAPPTYDEAVNLPGPNQTAQRTETA